MTRDQMLDALSALLAAFPSVHDFYTNNQLRDVWLQQLADCEAADVAAVINEVIAGNIELPPNYAYDRIAVTIRKHARDMRAKRRDEQRMEDLLATPSADHWKYNLGSLMKASRAAGEKLKSGEITKEENDRIVADLRAKARERA